MHFLEPVPRGEVTVIWQRWEATGPGGRLFPVLDANIILVPDGTTSLLGLAGVYGPPGGAAGAGLDRAVLHHVAAATIRSFLYRTAVAITEAARARGAAGQPAVWPGQLAPETP